MCADTGEQGGRRLAGESQVPERAALLEGAQAEAQCRDRMIRQPQELRAGELRHLLGTCHEGREQPVPGRAVPAQLGDGSRQAAVGEARGAARQRMPVGDLRNCQFDPFRKPEALKELRSQREWMHRRADVMVEARQGEFRRGGTASHAGVLFVDAHRESGPGQGDRSGEAVGPGANHYRVDLRNSPPHRHHVTLHSSWEHSPLTWPSDPKNAPDPFAKSH